MRKGESLMDLFKEISENKFVLIMLTEKQYEERLMEIVKKVEKNHTKICYVCLSKPYTDVIEYIKKINLDISKFFFIDVLTSHYKKPKAVKNCIFVEDPNKLIAIHVAINKAITEKNCSVVIFDTISSLLMYEQTHDIVKFTHQLTIEKKHQDVNKVFIILKDNSLLGKYYEPLVRDVEMFVDKTIDFGKNNKQD
jgi:archaellum biogenesis ATPase FlaH